MTDRDSRQTGTGAGGAIFRYAPSRFIEPLFSLISLPILTRMLGADGYGNLSVMLLTIGLIRNLIYDWVGNCALRFRTIYAADLDRFFSNVVAALLVSTVIGAALVFPLQIVLSDGALAIVGLYLWWLLADAAISGFAMCGEMVARATQRPFLFSMSRLGQAASRHLLGVIGFALMALDFSNYFGWRIAGVLLVTWWTWRALGGQKHLKLNRIDWGTQREFLLFGVPLTVVLFANAMRVIGNRYVVLWIDGADNTGLFSAAANLGGAPMLVFQQVVMLGLYPVAIKAYDKSQSILPIVADGLRYYFLAAVPALVGISVLAKPILAFVAGPAYAPAWPVLVTIAGATFAYGLSQYYSLPLMVEKRTGLMALITAGVGLLNLVASVWLVGLYGYVAAGVTTLLANLILLAGMMVWGLPEWRQAVPLQSLARIMGAAAVMLLVLMAWGKWVGFGSVWLLLCAIILGAVIYGLLIWRSGEIAEELGKMRTMWSHRFGPAE